MLLFTDSLYLLVYFFRTLHKNTQAYDVILIARQSISNVVCRSFLLFTLLQEQTQPFSRY